MVMGQPVPLPPAGPPGPAGLRSPGAPSVEDLPLLRMEGIAKDFDGVKALRGAQLAVRAGEVHALLGENGAGKSTLIRILCGAIARDSGSITWMGSELELSGPSDATAAGIRVIHQHLSVVDHLSVRENLTLGTERSRLGFIDTRESRRRAREALDRLGVELDLDRRVGDLRIAEKQLVEIARAMSPDARLLVMDEPTASLGDREVQHLFEVIDGLRARGVAIIYISHRLEEVKRLADRITVLRDGQTVGTVDADGIDRQEIVRMMVGRLTDLAPRQPAPQGEVVLEVSGVSTDTGLRDVSLELRAGEVLGLYGLLGSGRTELARALCGADPISRGTVRVDGRSIELHSPRDGRAVGIGLIPEDRTAQALFPRSPVRENVTAASEDLISTAGWLRGDAERRIARSIVDELRIRTPSIEQPVAYLSGGNQQKVVLGRWLVRQPRVLILDDPTVGVDVGAKEEIYRLIDDMTHQGTGVILISSELPELLALADRLLVLHQGRLAGMLSGDGMTQEAVLHLATGGA